MARTHGRSRPLAATAITATIAAMLLAGCSTPSEPPAASGSSSPEQSTSTPTPSASPSPSPTSTLAEPQPGPDFERTDEKGAVAAAEYFVELYSYMVHTGDTTTFKKLAWPKTCVFCDGVLDFTKRMHAKGSIFEGGDMTIEVTKTYDKDTMTNGYPLDATVTESDLVVRDTQGKRVHTEPGEVTKARFELLHDGTTWRLVNILDRKNL